MRRWYTVRPMLLAVLLLGAGVAVAQEEHLRFKLDETWRIANRKEDRTRQMLIMEFTRHSEPIDAWTELVTMQDIGRERFKLRPAQMMDELKAAMRTRCPDVVWNVLEERADGLIYEWRIANCPGQTDQHEVARIVEAKMNIWRLAYTKKVAELPADVRQEWLDWLGQVNVYVSR